MFYFINQLRTQTIPIGLAKTETELLDQLRMTYMEMMNAGSNCNLC